MQISNLNVTNTQNTTNVTKKGKCNNTLSSTNLLERSPKSDQCSFGGPGKKVAKALNSAAESLVETGKTYMKQTDSINSSLVYVSDISSPTSLPSLSPSKPFVDSLDLNNDKATVSTLCDSSTVLCNLNLSQIENKKPLNKNVANSKDFFSDSDSNTDLPLEKLMIISSSDSEYEYDNILNPLNILEYNLYNICSKIVPEAKIDYNISNDDLVPEMQEAWKVSPRFINGEFEVIPVAKVIQPNYNWYNRMVYLDTITDFYKDLQKNYPMLTSEEINNLKRIEEMQNEQFNLYLQNH